MTNFPELVAERHAFLNLRDQCETIIDTQRRLPDFVFRRSFAKYFAIEHYEIHRKEFALFLSMMAHVFKDDSVNYMTFDPDPEDYYFRHYEFFGLASFRPADLSERYLPVMSRNRHVDSFLARGGDVGAFWGSSLNWAIVCDRISWELALIAVSQDTDVPTKAGLQPIDSAHLSSYIQSLYSSVPSKASEASAASNMLAMNYPL